MRILLPILLAALPLPAPPPPRLEVRPAGLVQLGSLGPAEARTQDYTFTNTSSAPIALQVADLAPGVTAAGPALSESFAPGGSLGLTLTVDAAGTVGPQTRRVRLRTDDPLQGDYYLPVALDVRPDLTVDVPRQSLAATTPDESPLAVYTFTRETARPTAFRLGGELPPYLEAEIDPGNPLSRLRVTLRPARIPPGATLGLETLRVETSAPQQPAFTLYLDWKFRLPIEALPSRVVFQDSGPPEQELRLRARDGRPFRVEGAQVEGAGFEVAPAPPAAPEQVLVIRRTAPGRARALLVLRFGGGNPPLEVPLSYLPGLTPARASPPGASP